MTNASFHSVKETFVRATSDLANIESEQKTKTMGTSLEEGVSSTTRTCHCTQPVLAAQGRKHWAWSGRSLNQNLKSGNFLIFQMMNKDDEK